MPGNSPVTEAICFPEGSYIMLFERLGKQPKDVLFKLCGVVGGAMDTVRIIIDDSGLCTASIIRPEPISGCDASNKITQVCACTNYDGM
jgi:hypothetical protein